MDADDARTATSTGRGEGSSGPCPELGARLRAARTAHGIALRELARRVGVSPSLVSQIETDKVQPSVGTLFAIASELGLSMDTIVFGGARPASPPSQRPEPSPDAAALVQRAADRDAATFGSGVRWERLTPTATPGAEFLYVTYEPGAESSPAGTFQRHAGREWSVVLRGTLHVSVAFDEFVLEPGDSITYDSTTPHRLENRSAETVHALWFQLGELPAAGAG